MAKGMKHVFGSYSRNIWAESDWLENCSNFYFTLNEKPEKRSISETEGKRIYVSKHITEDFVSQRVNRLLSKK